MPYVGTTRKGLTSRDGLWLAAAVLLHAGLLLVPISPEPVDEPHTDRPLQIELTLGQLAEQPFVQPDPLPEPDPPPEAIEPQLPPQQPEPPPDPVMEIAAEESKETPDEARPSAETAPALSTALLLQSAADQDWPLATEDTNRKLGVFVPQEIPGNWRPSIELEDNLFDGMTIPRKVEIVDRWVSSDGSQNVVINTPNGATLCGRGLAWDPMQPLVEMVMQYRPCGGGGKRTFEMPARYLKNGDDSEIANSTTN